MIKSANLISVIVGIVLLSAINLVPSYAICVLGGAPSVVNSWYIFSVPVTIIALLLLIFDVFGR